MVLSAPGAVWWWYRAHCWQTILNRLSINLWLNIKKTKIMASSPITSWQIDGETMETVTDFIFLGSKITADDDCSHEIKMLASWKKRHYFTDKGQSSQSYGFSSSHVWMWELDYKESWAPKNWCFWTVLLNTRDSLGQQGYLTSQS